MYCKKCETAGSSGFPTGSRGYMQSGSAETGIRYCENCQSVMRTDAR
ncbi:MAG: hypothetical protein ABEJ55_00585 [Halanaeroarchaeum sp.]